MRTRGRIGRVEHWLTLPSVVLGSSALTLAVKLLLFGPGPVPPAPISTWLFPCLSLLCVWLVVAANVRRAHDLGHSTNLVLFGVALAALWAFASVTLALYFELTGRPVAAQWAWAGPFVPVTAFVAWLLYLGFSPGEDDANLHGMPESGSIRASRRT